MAKEGCGTSTSPGPCLASPATHIHHFLFQTSLAAWRWCVRGAFGVIATKAVNNFKGSLELGKGGWCVRVCRGGRREGHDWPPSPGLRVAMCVDELDEFGCQLNLALVGCTQPWV